MSTTWRSHLEVKGVAVLATLLLAVTTAGAGMAELGRKKNLADPAPGPEAAGDTAVGDGSVGLLVGNDTFTYMPAAGQTVSTILTALAAQINGQSPQNYSASVAGAVITVVRNPSGNEVAQFGMVNTDSGFGFVEASHQGGALFLLAACVDPAGNGIVQVRRDGVLAAEVSTAGLGAEALNSAIAAQLGGPVQGTCSAGLLSQQRRRIVVPGNFTRLSWEDNDTALTEAAQSGNSGIGVRNSLGGGNIPTLSEWGLILMLTALAAAALFHLRRRPAPASR